MERLFLQNPLHPYPSQRLSWEILQLSLGLYNPFPLQSTWYTHARLTHAHGAPVVEYATSTHTVACVAPVTTMTAAPTVFPTTTVPVFMQKTAATPPVQFIDRVVNVPVTAHRQTLVIQKVQKTVEVPQIQFIDKFADASASVQTEGKKRKLRLPTEGKTLFVNTASGDAEEDEGETHAPVHFSLCDGDELETRSKGEHEGATIRQVDDILLEMKDVKSELLHVRELIGVLVRKEERCAETKAEIAARNLDRLEREQDEQAKKVKPTCKKLSVTRPKP